MICSSTFFIPVYYLLTLSTPKPAAMAPPQTRAAGGKKAIATPQAATPADAPGFSFTTSTALSAADAFLSLDALLKEGKAEMIVIKNSVTNMRIVFLR